MKCPREKELRCGNEIRQLFEKTFYPGHSCTVSRIREGSALNYTVHISGLPARHVKILFDEAKARRIVSVTQALLHSKASGLIPELTEGTESLALRPQGGCLLAFRHLPGVPREPAMLSRDDMRKIFETYLAFSEALNASDIPDIAKDFKENAVYGRKCVEKLREIRGKPMRGLPRALSVGFRRRIDETLSRYAAAPEPHERPCFIHGDFHSKNILFDGGAISGIIDFENVRFGYRAEDFCRFIITLVMRLPFFWPKRGLVMGWLNLVQRHERLDSADWLAGWVPCELRVVEKSMRALADSRMPVMDALRLENALRELDFVRESLCPQPGRARMSLLFRPDEDLEHEGKKDAQR
jgi:hypothetical protein